MSVVRDHCHFTGKFRAAVQQQCNLHYNIDKVKYNSERYISFSVGRLKFIDFMQLLSCSLETLAAQWNDDQFTHLKTASPNPAQWSRLRKKVVYCYDYMSSMERFDETSLPHQTKLFQQTTW